MRVVSLEVGNLRIIADISIEPSPALNLISGPNGSGKSSLLEALHILGSGRSFRSHRLRDVVRRESDSLRVVGRTLGDDGLVDVTGIEYSRDGLRIRRGGNTLKAASDLARTLPIVAVTPDSYRLVTDGADIRRRIIDRLLFHMEPSSLGVHQRYRKALRQRNAAIRGDPASQGLSGWSKELAIAGSELTEIRMRHAERILPLMVDNVSRFVGRRMKIRFYPGWDSAISLEDAYERTLAADRMRGYTALGPHRADLKFSIDGHSVRQTLSRGETKLFVMAIAVTQVHDIAESVGSPPMVLVDDLASELDIAGRNRCLGELRETGAQLFLTEIPGSDPLAVGQDSSARVFHVKHGQVGG
ncbi:DNA replication/repair protein RecF [Thioalkalivibrio sp. HK1]|uniref:DNA replication/repair protein RecF n=1 Tax=Thioalkalivibrio sp. HK1 TaxID=1469245 RepID=UPI000471D429|nr:DNA replication and repair protein RecF [Thioalkalivibrio sp. HK1]